MRVAVCYPEKDCV